MMDWMKYLRPLTEARGVSGDEGRVRDAICALLPSELVCETDVMGNLIVYKQGLSDKLLMVSAHMDEPGMLLETADEKGGIRFTAVGELDPRTLAGRQVWVCGKERDIPGVIGVKPIHVLSAKERETPMELDEMYVDIGCRSREDALRLADPGDSIVFGGGVESFGDGLIRGRALDSRSGCALLIELLNSSESLPCNLAAVFTSQRRTGSAGMKTVAFRLQPQMAIVLESAPSAFGSAKKSPLLSKGPVISLREKAGFYDKALYRTALESAKTMEIPLQQRMDAFVSTDAAAVQLVGRGSRVLELSIPTRNAGTPCCIQSLADLDNAFRLLYRLATEIIS